MWIWESTIGIVVPPVRFLAGLSAGPHNASGSGGGWRRLLERGLRGRGDRLESLGLADRDVREHLAVEIEPGQLDAVHELRVGQPVLACAGIDPLDPQRAKITLAVAPVAIGVAQRLLDLFDRDAVGSAAAPAIALGELEDLLVAGVGSDPAFDARQGSAPEIGHVGQDELRVARLHRRGAAPQPLALGRFADQPVTLVAPVPLDLACGGTAKALLCAALCLQLGHLEIRLRPAAPRHSARRPFERRYIAMPRFKRKRGTSPLFSDVG